VAQSRAATWHPIIGCWFVCKNFGLASPGVEPATSGGQRTNESRANHRRRVVVVIQTANIVFKLVKVLNGGKKGPGLSPSPRRQHTTHTIPYRARVTIPKQMRGRGLTIGPGPRVHMTRATYDRGLTTKRGAGVKQQPVAIWPYMPHDQELAR
jgi:hypothetical protein